VRTKTLRVREKRDSKVTSHWRAEALVDHPRIEEALSEERPNSD
jgi:hypothetical protein